MVNKFKVDKMLKTTLTKKKKKLKIVKGEKKNKSKKE